MSRYLGRNIVQIEGQMEVFGYFWVAVHGIHEHFTSGYYFIFAVNVIKFNRVTTRTTIWYDCSQFNREAMAGNHLLRGDVLNFLVLILGRYVANGYELNSFLIAVWNVDEHRAEVTHASA